MGINNFKDGLRERVVELIDSKRGTATKLAKSIGKSGSYFSRLKQGDPVNALHLKAIGNVFGSDKLSEIMDIRININDDLSDSDNTVEITDAMHSEIVKFFKQKELAKQLNWDLIELEKYDPNELSEVHGFIKYRLSRIKSKAGKESKKQGGSGGNKFKKVKG